jgi:RNA polymerase sigma-B factor
MTLTTRETRDPRTTREQRTEELLGRLAESSPTEREAITAELVELNLGLCDALANRYANRGADRDDLVQVARLALLMAVRRYRPAEGRSFVAFAVPTITGELKRPPRRIQELRARATRQRQELEQRLGRRPTSGEVVADLGVDPALLRESDAAEGTYRALSLDAPFEPSGDTNLASTLAGTDPDLDALLDRITLQRMLAGFTRRDRQVLRWRFEEGCTQAEIGSRLGVSQMQVSRILRRILLQARAALTQPAPLAG